MSPFNDDKIMWLMVSVAIILLIALTLVLFRWL